MARRKDLSGGITWRDAALAWEHFEGLENVDVSMTIQSTLTKGLADLLVTAVATQNNAPSGEVPRSDSVSATCLGTRLLSLEAVVFHLLYVLDFRFAASEYGKEGK